MIKSLVAKLFCCISARLNMLVLYLLDRQKATITHFLRNLYNCKMSVKKQIHLALDTGNDSFAPTLHHVYLYLKSTAITILTTIVSTYCMLKYYIPPCKIYPWIMDWRENVEAIS